MDSQHFMRFILKERPVGTAFNETVLRHIESEFLHAGYETDSLPFDCLVWEFGDSELIINENKFHVFASPFSKPFHETKEAVIVENLKDIKECSLLNKIVILCGELAKTPLQPKDYPVYYPDEHKAVITLLEEKQPAAMITATGKDPLRGITPFPMFEDGNFAIPSAYMSDSMLPQIKSLLNKWPIATLTIDSNNRTANSRQLIASKKSDSPLGKIVVCAHMDTKYNTVGALDNATGIAILLQLAHYLQNISCPYDIDFVPFNSEEYYEYSGEVLYLNYTEKRQDNISLVINIDSPCHHDSRTAISTYNLDNITECIFDDLLTKHIKIEKGDRWYAGDHCAFVFKGVPCIAVTSSDFFSGGLKFTHTPSDTLDTIDLNLINPTASYLLDVIQVLANHKISPNQ